MKLAQLLRRRRELEGPVEGVRRNTEVLMPLQDGSVADMASFLREYEDKMVSSASASTSEVQLGSCSQNDTSKTTVSEETVGDLMKSGASVSASAFASASASLSMSGPADEKDEKDDSADSGTFILHTCAVYTVILTLHMLYIYN